MSALLKLLNDNAQRSPDEIVQRLSPIIYFFEMTSEVAARNQHCEMMLFKYNIHNEVWEANEQDWEFWGYGEENYFRQTLWNYACIPMENYVDGLLPTRTPERADR